jgi:hypothetical protein
VVPLVCHGAQAADPEMLAFMQKLREEVTVGIVGGSDLVKISEQLGANGAHGQWCGQHAMASPCRQADG